MDDIDISDDDFEDVSEDNDSDDLFDDEDDIYKILKEEMDD